MDSRALDNAWARRCNLDEQQLIHFRRLYVRLKSAQDRTRFKQLMAAAVKLQDEFLQLTANLGDMFLNLRLEVDNCTAKHPDDCGELQPGDIWHAIPSWESFSKDRKEITRRLG